MSTRLKSWLKNGQRLLLLLGAAVGGIAVLVVLLGPIASRATPGTNLRGRDQADAINATRQILLAAVGGLALLTGAAFTTRTYYLSRRGQLTDRYTNAIALLASEKTTERIGGIYALEHLMIESDRDHETVVEVLAAFIREQTTPPAPGKTRQLAEHRHKSDQQPRLATDVQAALTVIGRRPHRAERVDLVDLSEADLCGARLTALNFDHATFWSTKLHSAVMIDTSLRGANLAWAQLQDAGLAGADLRSSYLGGAQLQKAVLMDTRLQHANLREADLRGAYLAGANLHGAILDEAQLQAADFIAFPIGRPAPPPSGLTIDQLSTAVVDNTTRLPDNLRHAIPDVATNPALD